MAPMGCGYGSEFHLLRYMGRYRNEFSRLVARAIQVEVLCWLDFQHGGKYELPIGSSKLSLPDQELKGLEFLDAPNFQSVLKDWEAFWPTTGNQQNWDAVGRVRVKCQPQWLLVEAKANTNEMISSCGATPGSPSMIQIEAAFRDTQNYFTITPGGDWTRDYYQLANRLAVLYFLRAHNIPARLLLIYFLGDKNPSGTCPVNESDWRVEINLQDRHIGLNATKKRDLGIHELFIEVAP